MSCIKRVTEPTLDVLRVLLQAYRDQRDVYGWEVRKQTGRSGPVVVGVFDRLEGGGLVEARWDDSPEARGPRRRYYRLTAAGADEAKRVFAARHAGP